MASIEHIRAVARPAANAALGVKLAIGRLGAGQTQEAMDYLRGTAAPAMDEALSAIGKLEQDPDATAAQREADLRPAATLRVRAAAAVALLKQADVLARAGLAEEAGDSRESALWTLERALALVPPFSPAPAAAQSGVSAVTPVIAAVLAAE